MGFVDHTYGNLQLPVGGRKWIVASCLGESAVTRNNHSLKRYSKRTCTSQTEIRIEFQADNG